MVRLWIENNGLGIEPEFQERIFRMFERLHPARVYDGTGIGLAIVRRAVQQMGGRVGVESDLGQGSRFWIQLPARKSAPRPGP
jgi:signal transduction histidine kinase